MKSFFKIIFATFFALVLFATCVVLLLIGVTAGLARLGTKHEPNIQNGSYLVLDLAENITDTPPPSEGQQAFNKLFSQGQPDTVSLRALLRAIHAAADDSRIAGIYVHGSFLPADYGSGYAAIKEVREALLAFRETKKPVVAYLIDPTTRDYYLASAADTIYMNPFGNMEMPGLNAESTFFLGAMKKFGIDVQVTRVGKYKSFAEPFLLDKMSPENREQTQALLDGVWHEVLAAIEQTRKVPAAQIQSVVDQYGLITPDVAKQNGLVNEVAYLPEVLDKLRKSTGTQTTGNNLTFRQVDMETYIKQKLGKPQSATGVMAAMTDSSPKVAIVYAEGDIVGGNGDETGYIAGDRFARELRRLREDAQVKAVVLRVNSPGGGVTASEVIRRELVLLHQAGKPLVVSMGTVAASGGYWISTAADHVFAEPNTITGSIGVVGLLPNIQGLANNNGVTFDNVKTGRYADLSTVSRPKTPEEMGVIQRLIDDDYQKFIDRVAIARKLSKERVEEIAQGRVWSGSAALKLGLVDEIGGLEATLTYTKKKAGVPSSVRIVEFPAQREFAEQLANIFGDQQKPVALLPRLGVSTGPLTREAGNVLNLLNGFTRLNDPAGAYARLPLDLTLN